MIFISSSCVRKHYIHEVVEVLAREGFRHIELSGGTTYYDGLEDRLIELKHQYQLHYLVHNYFPPPPRHIVLNLASATPEIFQGSMDHIRRAIALSSSLGSTRYSFHAGFFIDLMTEDLGSILQTRSLNERSAAIDRFCKAYTLLRRDYPNMDFYVENNVLSESNHQRFPTINPFMLTCVEDYEDLRRKLEFQLLLDIAHLKVSSRSLNLSFSEQLRNLITVSDYIHISDNNGREDKNLAFEENSELFRDLKSYDFTDKIITLEVYGSMGEIHRSYETASLLMSSSS